MRIAFVWTGFTSYMADCWRELSARDGVTLKVWVEQVRGGNIAFDPGPLMAGIDFNWAYSDEIDDARRQRLADEIAAFAPDRVFVCGWARRLPPFVAKCAKLAAVPKTLCCDMPWEWKLRKVAARFVLWRHLRRFDTILVPGRRAARYARWLGFAKDAIVEGEYAIRTERFADGHGEKRRGFVFVGRLVPDKAIRTLAEAYRRYRAQGGEWPLDVYGMGPEDRWFENTEGVSVHGFVQPDAIPAIYARAGAFVLASVWDPWPLVILESCAAGLPVICTRNCWNRYELIRENGIVVPCGKAAALAAAMSRAAELDGSVGRVLSAPYSCRHWADLILRICHQEC